MEGFTIKNEMAAEKQSYETKQHTKLANFE